jgi:hypothetical protein
VTTQIPPTIPKLIHRVVGRIRFGVKIDAAITPRQAPIASTAKSLNLACLPGTISCKISNPPDSNIAKIQRTSSRLGYPRLNVVPVSRKIMTCSKLCGTAVTGRSIGGTNVKTMMIVNKHQARVRVIVIKSNGVIGRRRLFIMLSGLRIASDLPLAGNPTELPSASQRSAVTGRVGTS